MAQESYADYSIIHKYFQQEKLHEEELQRFKDQVQELNEKLSNTSREAEGSAAKVRELTNKCETLQQAVNEKENDLNRLNATISNLNRKIANITKAGRR